jgi:type VI secretion system secreted protein VgrG
MPYTQENRQLGIETPLGGDALMLTRLAGREEMSRLFHFELECLSEDDGLPAPAIVGKNVTFWVEYPDGEPRHFNGIVNRFAYCGRGDRLSVYRVEVVPWLWFLTKTTDCRIFQSKSIPDILKQVFSDLGLTHFKFDLQGKHPTWDYCVQYRESDFNFVSRLMEEEGMFYFFQHEKGKHTLVVADHKDACKDARDKEIEFKSKLTEDHLSDHVWRWEHQYEFRTGKWAHTDYNFETPSTSLMSNTSSVVKLEGISKYEQYEFPGGYEERGDGDAAAKLRMEEEEAGFDVVTGEGHCRSFSPGAKFKMKGHHSPREKDKGYVITSVEHRAGNENSYWSEKPGEVQQYANTFRCIPDSVTFRPARVTEKPLIQSVQTAVITGPPGEEIFTDKHGRVKVQFHWDREGKKDDKTSCWIRVSQIHAGKGWGGIDIPRIGEEVVVSFLEGDPDRPLITGRVYNAEQTPPFGLDGADNATNKVISGMKSKTYKGAGYNELIMDDTPGKELIRVHGQYDMDTTIEHDKREKVLNDRKRNVTQNETITIGVNRTEEVGGNQSTTIKGHETSTVYFTRTHSVGINDMLNVGGLREVTVVGAMAHTVGAGMALTVAGGYAITTGFGMDVAVGGVHKESTKKSRKIEAADSFEVSCGKSKLVLKSDGTITLEGTEIKLAATGDVKVTGTMIELN